MPFAPKPKNENKYWEFINPHGVKITVENERHAIQYKKDKRFMLINEYSMPVASATAPIVDITPEIVADPLECQLCGYLAKNKQGITMHKRKKGHE